MYEKDRFGVFTEQEKGLMTTAFFIAIEQWRKDADAVPDMRATFEKQIEQAEGFREEIGW